MKIFVTGGSGFLGGRLIRRLVRDGHEVLALARSPTSRQIVQQLGATPLTGDLDTLPEWNHALAGIDCVVHAAAPVEYWGEWAHFERDIVEATINLYRAANHHGVRQFIFISTEAVLQGDKPLLDITEAEPYPAEPNSIYGRAKKLAEMRLRESRFDTAITILRPSFIWGRDSPALLRMRNMVKSHQFVWVNGGSTPFERVHVDNVVEAIYLALQKGSEGLYLLTDDEPGSIREFLAPAFTAMGLHVPRLSLPSALLDPLARGLERAWTTIGINRSPPLTRFELAFLSQPRRYDIKLIKRELGYVPVTSTDAGIAELKKEGRT